VKTLHRTVMRGVSAGEPLPSPYPIFDQRKMAIRRGTVNMVAGPPGSMKTTFLLNLVKNMGTEVPTLYHSSDSDDFTMASRVLSMVTGDPTSESEFAVMAQSETAYAALKAFEHVRWSFRSSPSIDDLRMEADAFREIKGTYPHHTIIDILMDVDYDGVSEQNYWGVMSELKEMARDHQTAITIAHHTSESVSAGAPPPRSAIMGKANQLPALILTLWGDGAKGTLDVATVKNRFGPNDPTAREYFTMSADPKVCLIEEKELVGLLFKNGQGVSEGMAIDVWGEDSE